MNSNFFFMFYRRSFMKRKTFSLLFGQGKPGKLRNLVTLKSYQPCKCFKVFLFSFSLYSALPEVAPYNRYCPVDDKYELLFVEVFSRSPEGEPRVFHFWQIVSFIHFWWNITFHYNLTILYYIFGNELPFFFRGIGWI